MNRSELVKQANLIRAGRWAGGAVKKATRAVSMGIKGNRKGALKNLAGAKVSGRKAIKNVNSSAGNLAQKIKAKFR